MNQEYIDARTVFRIWNVKRKQWWSPKDSFERTSSKGGARDLFFRRHTELLKDASWSLYETGIAATNDTIGLDAVLACYEHAIDRASAGQLP